MVPVLQAACSRAASQLPTWSYTRAIAASGWAQAWFALAALVMQLILNTKLVYIARHSTRGGHVHRLERSVFWFGSEGPWSVPTLAFLQTTLLK